MIRLLALLPFLWATTALACQQVEFDGASFTACEVDLAEDDVRLFLRDDAGAIYGSFARVDAALPNGQKLGVAMNAGMFHADRAPVGLYIEDGSEEMRVITTDGPGNFGLLPNGVLCLGETQAAVIESRAYAADPPDCVHATQSGPMLVIDGALHPRFLPDSTSRFVRNGVGTSPDGTRAVFVISNQAVTFHEFGRLFRDHLDLDQALYFDGNVSRIRAPELGRNDGGFSALGPIIGVVEKPGS